MASISQKTKNLMRIERKANPPIEDVLKRMEYRSMIIAKPHGSHEAKLRDRYIEEENTKFNASKLYEQYQEAGITWAACVQAAKTHYIEHLHNKWSPRLKAVREEEKTNSK